MMSAAATNELDRPGSECRLVRYSDFQKINGPYFDWQMRQLRPWIKSRVLEIGCGVGGILERLPPCSLIHSLDVEEDVLEAARLRLKHRPECRFSLLDLAECEEEQVTELVQEKFDTVLAVNVLEHIENDVKVLQRAERVLQPGGCMLILVPAHPSLFGEYDRLDGHFRRYTKRSLTAVIQQTRFSIVQLRYFNMLGALGWWWHYRIMRRTIHGAGQFGIMNRSIPIMRRIEQIIAPPFGLSVVAVVRARKGD